MRIKNPLQCMWMRLDWWTGANLTRPLFPTFDAVFAAFAPGLPAGVEGFLEKQRRPATNTAEAKGQMCISACVKKKRKKKKKVVDRKKNRNHDGSFVFTPALTVASPQKQINNHE